MKNTIQPKPVKSPSPFFFISLSFLVILFITSSCQAQPTSKDLSQLNLIPIPVSVTPDVGSFEITARTAIYVKKGDTQLADIANYLSEFLQKPTRYKIAVKNSEPISKNAIVLELTNSNRFKNSEGYLIDVENDVLRIQATEPEGIFRGIQTLRQLLPARIEKENQQGPWIIASGSILDYPQYEYRGAMLDVSRHFFPVEDVKRFIDFLAMYKMNKLHLHLSDDQGWRIEIKSWSKLTEYGGSTEVGGGEGGYFTQEDYKEIIDYAQERYIEVIPEIDMPGHTNSALASYPELNCNDEAPDLYTGTEVGFSSFCTDKEITYKFIDDVIRELAAITPGKYIHIGGDESHSTDKEDYIQFINKVQDIVYKHGKTMIGWDEIQNAKLRKESVTQFWASEENALGAVKQGSKLIMSPAKKAYMDMQYDSNSPLGLHWAGYVEVDTGYNWNPSSYIKGITKDNILGVEAPLWTETIQTMDDIEYMIFPRLAGFAEIGWSQDSLRNWESYKIRLNNHYERFEALEVNFYKSKTVSPEKL